VLLSVSLYRRQVPELNQKEAWPTYLNKLVFTYNNGERQGSERQAANPKFLIFTGFNHQNLLSEVLQLVYPISQLSGNDISQNPVSYFVPC
jgi:hypothetical protein